MKTEQTTLTFVLPLSNGIAYLLIPVPMLEEDFNTLMQTANLWKKRLVQMPPPMGWEYETSQPSEKGN